MEKQMNHFFLNTVYKCTAIDERYRPIALIYV